MTAEEIRDMASDFDIHTRVPDEPDIRLQSTMLAEIAAQVAELNETLKAIAETYILGKGQVR